MHIAVSTLKSTVGNWFNTEGGIVGGWQGSTELLVVENPF